MKISLQLATALLLPMLCAHHAVAQQYVPTANQCLRSYYDPSSYNWLTYQNTCNQPLHITLVSRSSGNVGALDLAPGRHTGPGLSANEVRSKGGVEAYACPAGYVAVDANDELISDEAVDTFRCKKS